MKKRNIIIFIILFLTLIVWVAISSYRNKISDVYKDLGSDENANYSGKIVVVSSLFPWYDLARQIGGDYVDVSLLLPPGVGAHSFEPRPKDMINIIIRDFI
jgi:zinc transport system substrate-binding protein